jgi:hypothetical protein
MHAAWKNKNYGLGSKLPNSELTCNNRSAPVFRSFCFTEWIWKWVYSVLQPAGLFVPAPDERWMWSNRKEEKWLGKPAQIPPRPPKISHVLTRSRTLGSRGLTAWVMAQSFGYFGRSGDNCSH